MSNEETYEGESGLLTDYVGVIIDSWFQANDRFGGMQLCLKQTTDNELTPEFTEMINCGKQWQTMDGGLTVESSEGKTKFHNNSRIQEFVGTAIKLGAGPVLMERGPAQEASVWLGLSFKWGEVKKEYTVTDEATGQPKSGVSSYNMPVEFLGVSEVDGGTAAGGNGAVPAEPSESVIASLDPTLVEELRAARLSSTTHHEFVDKAVSLTGVAGNTTLVGAIADEDQLWNELGE